MRIWDIPPDKLCRQHLLGEHNELHAMWHILPSPESVYSTWHAVHYAHQAGVDGRVYQEEYPISSWFLSILHLRLHLKYKGPILLPIEFKFICYLHPQFILMGMKGVAISF